MNGEVIGPAKVIVSKLPPQPETTEEAVESDVPSSDTIEQTDSSATAEMDTSMVTDSESSDTEKFRNGWVIFYIFPCHAQSNGRACEKTKKASFNKSL